MRNLLLSLAACLAALPSAASDIPVYLDDDAGIEARVEDALSRMTLNEKIAMCHAQSKFSAPGCPRLGIPEIWFSDGPHGVRMTGTTGHMPGGRTIRVRQCLH